MANINLFKELLNDGGSATFATMTAEVEVKMRKTGNPLRDAKVTKLTKYHMLLNAIYTNMVNNQRMREGETPDFVAKENWFEKTFDGRNGSIVNHKVDKEKFYLKFACGSAETSDYFVDGVKADTKTVETIKQFRIVSVPPTNQGIENPIIIRTVKLENVRELNCNGVKVTF